MAGGVTIGRKICTLCGVCSGVAGVDGTVWVVLGLGWS